MRLTRSEVIASLWSRGDLTYKLHAGQKLIYDQLEALPLTARQIVFLCGRRFGKSFFTLVLALMACLRRPGNRILLCAPKKDQTPEIAGPLMDQITIDMPQGLMRRHRSSYRWHFANGSTLIMSGIDHVAETIRGQEFDDIYLEEPGAAKPDDFMYIVKSILLPTLLKTNGRIFYVTTPSKVEDHPLHLEIFPRAEAQGALFTFPTSASPLYTPEQLAEMATEVGGVTSIDWLREFECKIVRDSNLVAVPEFDADSCVRDFEAPKHFKAWIGGDWGGVRDRTAFLLMTWDFDRAKILILDERSFPKHTMTQEIVGAVKLMEREWKVTPPRWVDAPGQLQVDLMGKPHEFPVTLPRKDSFEASINLVRTMIASLEVHPRCAQLIQTLKYARLNKQRTDFERTDALGHADALMALCYGLRYVNRANPYPSAAANTHLGSHYVPEGYRPNQATEQAANTLRQLFR